MHPGSRGRWLMGALAMLAASAAWWAFSAADDGSPYPLANPAADPPASPQRESRRPEPELVHDAGPSASVTVEGGPAGPLLEEPAPPSSERPGAGALSPEDPAFLAAWRDHLESGGGLVVGRVLSPPGPTEVRLVFEAEDSRYAEYLALDEDGDTELHLPLDPGIWSGHLDCRYCFEETPLATEFRVDAGSPSRPPELNPLDLASYLDAAAVHVVDASGAPFTRAEIRGGTRGYGTDEEGVARLLFCRAPHALTVRSFGYRTVDISLRPGFQEVVMRRGPRVRFKLAAASLHLESEAAVGATLSLGDKTVGGVLALGEDWTRAMHLSEPATYRVVWSLRAPGATRPTFLADSPLASRSIDVKDVEEVQDFVLRFPEARLREALAELEDGLEDGR